MHSQETIGKTEAAAWTPITLTPLGRVADVLKGAGGTKGDGGAGKTRV